MLFHDPYSLLYRNPLGAVTVGTQVTLRLIVRGENENGYSLMVRFPDGESRKYPLHRTGEILFGTLETTHETGLFYYAFAHEETGRQFGPEGITGVGAEGNFWPVTVYEAGYTTPAWFCDSVCYQIFPDRFRRSSLTDTASAADYHRARGRRIYLHEDWTEEPAYTALPGQEEYAPEDYFGGNLKGIEEKLPYLRSLGIGSIYLNPVFEADSNHRYNTADYMRIDPLLGTEEDLRSLAEKASECGIRLILDGVFSHTGADSRYFDSRNTYGSGASQSIDSPYYPWYRFEKWPDTYECWWGFKTLPNVEETEKSYGAFIHGEDGVLSHWMSVGASGWRLDVADELPDVFIRQVRERIKKQDPEGVLIGEVWEDCSDKEGPEGRRGYVDGLELDGTMNYPLRKALLGFLNGDITAYDAEEKLWSLYLHYPRPFYEASLNLISSHDETRAISFLSGAPDRFKSTREEQAAFATGAEAQERGRNLFLCATALQMVLPGVPCIYYGDEVGQTGIGDPTNRRTYPWGREDVGILSAVKTLTGLRNTLHALKREASFRMGALTENVFAVLRTEKDAVVLLLVNRGTAQRNICYYPALTPRGADGLDSVPLAGTYRDAFIGETVKAGSTLQVRIPGCGFRLLVKE